MEGHIFEGRGMRAVTLPFEKIRVLPQETRRGEGFLPRRMAPVVAAAEEMLGREIPAITKELWELFFTTGERQRFDDAYIERRTMLLTLTLAESFEGQGRFLCKLCEVLRAILDEPTWIIAAHLEANSDYRAAEGLPPRLAPGRAHGLDIMAGATGACVAVTYYYLGDVIRGADAGLYDKMAAAFRVRIIDPFLLSHAHWTGPEGRRVNNWCPWIISNILCAAALTCPDMEKRERITDTALESLSVYMDTIKPEGGCDEGPGYWHAAGLSTFMSLLVVYDMTGGKLNFFGEPQLKNMAEYIMKMHISGNRFANFADCSPILKKNYAAVSAFGKYTGSEAVCHWTQTMNWESCLADVEHGYRLLVELCTAPQKPQAPYVPEAVTEQSDLGIAFLRNAHFYAAFKGGHNAESHNHNDVGTNIVFKDGAPILIDIGNDQYTKLTFSDKRYTLPANRSIYHNTLSTDDTEQLPGVQYHAENFSVDAASKTASMTLEKAYAPESGITSYRKTTALTASGVTITNEFTLDKERTAKLNLILCAKPEPISENAFAVTSDGVRAVIRYTPGLAFAVEVLPLDEHPFWRRSYPNADAIYRVILSKKTSGESLCVTVE